MTIAAARRGPVQKGSGGGGGGAGGSAQAIEGSTRAARKKGRERMSEIEELVVLGRVLLGEERLGVLGDRFKEFLLG